MRTIKPKSQTSSTRTLLRAYASSQTLRADRTDIPLDEVPAQEEQASKQEPLVIDWKGPNDPENPKNWSNFSFFMHFFLVSLLCLAGNLATTMYAPGTAQLAIEFKTKDSIVIAMTVSIYLLGFSLAPMVLSPLSEVYGRLILYHTSNIFFLAFNLACAFSTNISMFIAFRFLAGCAGSTPMTVGGGTITDFSTNAKKDNTAMKLFGLGPVLGPVIGPIVGGFVSEHVGWRWTFRIMSIIIGVLTILSFIFLRETSANVILRRKGAAATKKSGRPFAIPSPMPGAPPIPQKPDSEIALRSLLRPLNMLLFLPQVTILSVYAAFIFGLIYLLLTTLPGVFSDQYGFEPGVVGLAYIGIGFGMVFGLLSFNFLNLKMANSTDENGQVKPESYLPLMTWFSPLLPIGFFWYGWAAGEKAHWAVPILGTFFVGFGSFAIIMPTTAYLVFSQGPLSAASVLAATNILRYLFAAFLPLAGPAMYEKLGLGWGNTLLGFLCLAMAPIPIIFQRYGEHLRVKFPNRW